MADKPKRRWLPRIRFSLRTLLFVVLLIGSGTALWLHWNPWRLVRELQMPKQIINCAEFSPDGRYIVTPHDDKLARIFNADTGELVRELSGHTARLVSATYSPDGTKIITSGNRDAMTNGNWDRTTRIWDAQTGKQLRVLPDAQGYPSIGISPDGKTIATVNVKIGVIQFWDFMGENPVGQTALPIGTAGVTFSPDSKRLVNSYAAFHDKPDPVITFDVESGLQLRTIDGYVNTYMTYSPDGQKLLMCNQSKDGSRIFDAESGTLIAFLEHSNNWAARYSPDGRRIATAGSGVIKIWDAETHSLLAQMRGPAGIYLSFSPDGTRMAIAHREGVQIWQRERPEFRWGVLMLPELWCTVLLACALIWSLCRDRKDNRLTQDPTPPRGVAKDNPDSPNTR